MLKSTKNLTRSTAAAIALAACMVAPSAFAQDAAKTSEAQAAMAQPQQASPPAADKAAEPARKSWSDLDVDQNGSLSSSEAAGVESLAKVFDAADANGDGELTQDEYKTWLAANASKQQPQQGG